MNKNTKIPSIRKGKIHNAWYPVKNYQRFKEAGNMTNTNGKQSINQNWPRIDSDSCVRMDIDRIVILHSISLKS